MASGHYDPSSGSLRIGADGTDATSIRGILIDPTPPTDDQVLTYDLGTNTLRYESPVVAMEQVYSCSSGLLVGQGVYFSGDLAVDLCDPKDASKMPARGFVATKPTATTCTLKQIGPLGGFVGLVRNTRYWFDPANPGGVTATAVVHPNIEQQAGIGASSGVLDIQLGVPPLVQV